MEQKDDYARFRLFFWGIPSPSGKVYSKDVAEAIVERINEEGLMASFSPKLNINLVSALVRKAEIKGNVVYAEIGLLDSTKELMNAAWEDDNYRATVVIKANPPESGPITMEHVTDISHVLIYS